MSTESVRTFEEMLPRTVREWDHAGLRCLVLKMPDLPSVVGDGVEGWHCGYVRLPDGCGLPMRGPDAPGDVDRAAHGGITFRGTPVGQSDGDWYGFDMGHCTDYEGPLVSGRYLHADGDAIEATERLADAIAAHVGRKS